MLDQLFTGVVLAGGRSRRMGRDKAFVEAHARPLAGIAHDALLAAGAAEVLSVGGDRGRLAALGFVAHADDHPGAGPLGGMLTALRVAAHEVVVVLACDLPGVSAAEVAAVVAALRVSPEGGAAVPVVDGRLQPLLAAYRREVRPALERAFLDGERSVLRALDRIEVRRLSLEHPAAARDADRPADLRPATLWR